MIEKPGGDFVRFLRLRQSHFVNEMLPHAVPEVHLRIHARFDQLPMGMNDGAQREITRAGQ